MIKRFLVYGTKINLRMNPSVKKMALGFCFKVDSCKDDLGDGHPHSALPSKRES